MTPTALAAHSLLLHATPGAGEVLPAPPAEIVLRFNNRVEKRLSSIRLVDPDGETRLVAPRPDGPPEELRGPGPAGPPGTWRLQWRVLSVDGHMVSGGYAFEVAAPGRRPAD